MQGHSALVDDAELIHKHNSNAMARVRRPIRITMKTYTYPTSYMLALFINSVAWFACEAGLYNYGDKICVTAEECDSFDLHRHAFKAVGRCIAAQPYGTNKPSLQGDGSYACEDNYYLKFEDGRAECIEEKQIYAN